MSNHFPSYVAFYVHVYHISVTFPSLLIKFSTLLPTLRIRFWQTLMSRDNHSAFNALLNSYMLLKFFFLNFASTIAHAFSIGLKSGEFAGHYRTWNYYKLRYCLVAFAWWAGAPSCWNINLSLYGWNSFYILGISYSCNIWIYSLQVTPLELY